MSIVLPKVFWPITINGTNNFVQFHIGGADHSIGIPQAVYTSAAALATAIQTSIRASGSAPAMNVTVDATGHFVFQDVPDGAFSMLWSRTTNSPYLLLGATAADIGPATLITNPNQHQNGWYCPTAPQFDSLPKRMRDADVLTLTLKGNSKFITENELTRRAWTFGFLPPSYTYKANETVPNTAIERWWESGRALFNYWPDGTVEGTFASYVLDAESIKQFAPIRQFPKKALYQVKLGALGFVP